MKKTTQLTMYTEKIGISDLLEILAVMFAAVGFLIVAWFKVVRVQETSVYGSLLFGALVLWSIKTILFLGICLFVYYTIYTLSFLYNQGPVAILNVQGIWINRYGFAPWGEITEFVVHLKQGMPRQFKLIDITVKDLPNMSKDSDWSILLLIFLVKLVGGKSNHIMLANIDAKNQDVVSFVKRYVKNCHVAKMINTKPGTVPVADASNKASLLYTCLKVAAVSFVLYGVIIGPIYFICVYFSYHISAHIYALSALTVVQIIRYAYLDPENR